MVERALVCLLIGIVISLPCDAVSADYLFTRDVAPILIRRCLECHNERDASGGLVLADAKSVAAGGASGPAIDRAAADLGPLMARVVAGEMPPPKRGQSQQLPAAEIETLRGWIVSGAGWPSGRRLDLYEVSTPSRGGRDWWSLQPVRPSAIPAVEGDLRAWSRSPLDVFIVTQLQDQGLEPAPPADRRTILIRAFLDAVGLPPDFDDIQNFESASEPDAFERQLDRLLASPQFGERWGRHWLDVVRYADTCGYERDQELPGAWKYRDWVIRAINEDLPYDQFVQQQLAGDEVAGCDESTVTATGLLRLGTWNDEPNDPQEYKYDRLEDLVHVTSTAFLGVTVKCARCHDHKFDPIPQVDYYRLAAAFWPGPIEPRKSDLLGGPSRDELGFDVLGWTDVRVPPPLHLLRKGEPRQPLGVVEPAHLSFVNGLQGTFEPPPLGARTTHRRRQLAEWISSRGNPLTPRVLVNRLWALHFGAGLVRTPDNFGFTGDKPTHPELLEWLASEALATPQNSSNRHERSYGSLKRLHRLLMTSSVYRQHSLHPRDAESARRDAGNRLWWRAERRRLDAESLHDRLLLVGGDLDSRMTGRGYKPTIQAEALEGLSRKDGAWRPSPENEQRRRAVYMFSQRSLLPPLMTTFDFVDTALPCAQRPMSIVAPQALALMNNAFAHERSQALARRVLREGPTDPDRQVQRAWQLALARNPQAGELAAAREHIASQRGRFARVSSPALPPLPKAGLSLQLTAVTGAQRDAQGRVENWSDQSGRGHAAAQSDPANRPLWVQDAIHGRPALRFSGRQFLRLSGQPVSAASCAVFAVVSDRSTTGGHREIVTNWNGPAGNSGSSLFLGMTGTASVRWSDDFSGVGRVEDREQPFILTAINRPSGVVIQQSGRRIAERSQPVSPRNLAPPYVIGRQGALDDEYWQGDLAELLIYDRELNDTEVAAVHQILEARYGLKPANAPPDSEFLALASLCHVLLNTNEFIGID